MFRSIRSKLICSHFGSIVLLSLVLMLFGERLMIGALKEAKFHELEFAASNVALETDAALADSAKILQRAALGRAVQDFPNNYRVLALAEYLAKYQEVFPDLSYLSPSGRNEVQVVDGNLVEESGYLQKDPLFESAARTPGAVVTAPVEFFTEFGAPGVPMALGLKRYFGDVFLGVLRAVVPLSRLTTLTGEMKIGEKGFACLVDREGRILYHPQASWIAETLSGDGPAAEQLIARLLAGQSGSGRATLLGTDGLVAYMPIPSAGWTVFVLMPHAEFMAGPERLRNLALGVIVVIGVLGLLLAHLLASRIAGPLTALSAAAMKIAVGTISPVEGIRTADEVGSLADSFNAMVRDLRKTTVSRNYLDNILRSMNDALIVIRPDGIIETVNARGCELLGYAPADLPGEPLQRLLAEPAGSFDVRSWLESPTPGQVREPEETCLRSADGREIAVSFSVAPMYDGAGNPEALICVAQDIRERKAAEEKLQNTTRFLESVLDSMADAITIIDARDYTIVRGNRLLLDSLGMKEEDVLGKSCYEVIHHECAPCALPNDPCPMEETVRTGSSVTTEHVHEGPGGQNHAVEITTAPVKDVRGHVAFVIHVARDITGRKKAESDLRALAERLAQSNRDLEDFAFIASHDLQEPLRKVLTFGERLKSRYAAALDEQGRDYLERMQGASARMQDLINGLLVYSRVTTKAQPLVPVDLGQVMREVIDDLEVRIEETGGRVEVGELLTVDADPLQMRQLLQNLVGNALKFRAEGVAPLVKVFAEGEPGSDKCRIMVQDNGIGFDEKHLERIFGVFQRLHGRDKYEGSGVGLAVCRKIAQRHGGSITAHSAPGEGAAFIVTLPLRQQREAAV